MSRPQQAEPSVKGSIPRPRSQQQSTPDTQPSPTPTVPLPKSLLAAEHPSPTPNALPVTAANHAASPPLPRSAAAAPVVAVPKQQKQQQQAAPLAAAVSPSLPVPKSASASASAAAITTTTSSAAAVAAPPPQSQQASPPRGSAASQPAVTSSSKPSPPQQQQQQQVTPPAKAVSPCRRQDVVPLQSSAAPRRIDCAELKRLLDEVDAGSRSGMPEGEWVIPTDLPNAKNLRLRLQRQEDSDVTYVSVVAPWAFPDKLLTAAVNTADPRSQDSQVHAARIALQDFLLRQLHACFLSPDESDSVTCLSPSQHVLDRSALLIHVDSASPLVISGVELHAHIALAHHRQPQQEAPFDSREWYRLVSGVVLPAARAVLLPFVAPEANAEREAAAAAHIRSVLDQQFVRNSLKERGLAAFIRNGAVLPRMHGASDVPMSADVAVPFVSPPSLLTCFVLPRTGASLSGAGIPRGITCIIGNVHCGKSTLLQALQLGVYDHIAGDGREFVVADPTAVKIRQEDHRAIASVDISPFAPSLTTTTFATPLRPFAPHASSSSSSSSSSAASSVLGAADVASFSTLDASGATSQAAALAEAVEAGCKLLLMDDDTSAAGFLARDDVLARLLPQDRADAFRPLQQSAKALYAELDVSLIVVLGASSPMLKTATTVILLDQYECRDITAEAHALVGATPSQQPRMPHPKSARIFDRYADAALRPLPLATAMASLHRLSGANADDVTLQIRSRRSREIELGPEVVDLNSLEQLVEPAQTAGVAAFIGLVSSTAASPSRAQIKSAMATHCPSFTPFTLRTLLQQSLHLKHFPPGGFVMPRHFEVIAAVARIREVALQTLKQRNR